MAQNCIDTKNYEGVRTIFTEAQRADKAKRHPELRQADFIQRVKEAVEKPDFVYEDLDKTTRFAYYCREYKINNRIRYTKVILSNQQGRYFVITAYRPDYVKERNKSTLFYGKDTD